MIIIIEIEIVITIRIVIIIRITISNKNKLITIIRIVTMIIQIRMIATKGINDNNSRGFMFKIRWRAPKTMSTGGLTPMKNISHA